MQTAKPQCVVSVKCDTGNTWQTRFNGTFSDARRYFMGLQTTIENDLTGAETVHTVTHVTDITPQPVTVD